MAPEQARGQRVDKRADIWAFGCVLYEMVTGQRAFPGDNVTDTIASVIKDRPDLSRVPEPIQRLVRRCLEKDPKLRLRDIADAWQLLESTDPLLRQNAAPAPRRSVWIAAAVLLAALGAGLAWSLKPAATPVLVVSRFAHAIGDEQNLGPRLAVSRDGRHVTFTANGQIHVRTLDDLVAKPVPITGIGTGSAMPFFSPDGEWIAFFTEGRLMKVRATGGTPTTLTQASATPGASWGADNKIVFVHERAIRRIPGEGGAAEVLVEAKDNEILSDPVMLADGKTLLYGVASTSDSAETRWDNARIMATQPGNPPKLLVQNGASACYVQSRHLLYVLRNTLFALPFDIQRLEKTGDPVAVVEGLRRERQWSVASYSVSDSGTLTFVPATRSPRRLVWIDRQGQEEVVGLEPQTYANPRISPDGSKVALISRDGGFDVWVWDFSRRALTQLTSDPSPNCTAAWLPDSKRLAFPYWTDTANQVHVQSADGSGQPQILEELTTPPTVRTYPVSVSVAGELAFTRYGGFPIVGHTGVMSLVTRGAAVTMRQNQRTDRNPSASPNGRWMAFESDRTGRFEIYVSPFPDVKGGTQQVTTSGGTMPVWSRDQKHLYYWTVEGGTVTIMEVPVAVSGTFTWGEAKPLLRGSFERPTQDTQYDVWNGRFLLLKAVESRESSPAIVIVQNWFEELKQRAPTQRR
jgi:Tol biopolymer transport system component